jgi:endonuclease/exonuclease/phosphatase (EEP) superfamily protein YafD
VSSAASAVTVSGIRILAALSLLTTVFVLLARSWWFFELFSHFRVQLVAAQALLLIIVAVLRWHAWALALGAALLVNGFSVRAYVLPLAQSASAADAEIGVITANVLAANDDTGGLVELIRAEDPDVFAVVEFTDLFAEALRDLGDEWPHRVLAPERGAFGAALYSRWPLARSSVFELEGFAAIHAEIAAAEGNWHFVAAHPLPPMSSAMARTRNRQLRTLAEFVGALNGPIVVAGDFNLTPFSPHFEDFTRQTGLRTALRGFGPGITWPAFATVLGIPIDHVFVSEEFEVVSYARAGDIGSDHFPVVVDMNRRRFGLD